MENTNHPEQKNSHAAKQIKYREPDAAKDARGRRTGKPQQIKSGLIYAVASGGSPKGKPRSRRDKEQALVRAPKGMPVYHRRCISPA
jgi:hypothetical protein